MLKVENEPSQAAPASASATATGGSDDGTSPSTSSAPPNTPVSAVTTRSAP